MPLPKKRPGQSKKAFMQSCMSNDTMVKEYPDQAQRAAICYRQFGEKKAKAAYVIKAGDDELLYTKSTVYLPAALVEKVKAMPESGPGYHNVKVTAKSGKAYYGTVNNCDEFVTDDDGIEDEDGDMTDVVLDD